MGWSQKPTYSAGTLIAGWAEDHPAIPILGHPISPLGAKQDYLTTVRADFRGSSGGTDPRDAASNALVSRKGTGNIPSLPLIVTADSTYNTSFAGPAITSPLKLRAFDRNSAKMMPEPLDSVRPINSTTQRVALKHNFSGSAFSTTSREAYTGGYLAQLDSTEKRHGRSQDFTRRMMVSRQYKS